MKNKIDFYSFGKISISKKEYNSDLIIFPDKILDNWWREKGHLLQENDLKEVIEFEPDKLIIGTGQNGRMKVPSFLINKLNKQNITTEVYKTDTAVKKYNKREGDNIVCALHLTC